MWNASSRSYATILKWTSSAAAWPSSTNTLRLWAGDLYPTSHTSILASLRRYNPIANSTVMFRRAVYEQFGGWRDSALPGQDYEWYSRLGAGGARFANLPEPLVRYRVHGGSIKSSRLHDTIRTTIEVKKMYWMDADADLVSRAMMTAEQLLLWLPAPLVLKLFMAMVYGGRR